MDAQSLAFNLQLAIGGISVGSVYALIALAIVIPFKASGVLNFGQGELATLGAYATLVLVQFGLPYAAVLAAVIAFSALVGVVMERVLIRPIVKAPPFTVVIATFAIGLAIKAAIQLVWGDSPHTVDGPFGDSAILAGPVRINPTSLWIVFCTVAVTLLVSAFFRFHRAGKAMRAVAINAEAASLMGIEVFSTYRWAWGLSAAVGGLTGLLVAPMTGVNPEVGSLILRGLVAAVLGGFTSVPGAIVGGLAVGLLETFAAVSLGATVKNLVPFIVLCLLLAFRPHGLFGVREVHRV
jgi:branched-chain amino acid transport system permease protein